jgi:uncharacterized protein YcbX
VSDYGSTGRVRALSVTAVKGTRLRTVGRLVLERGGARGDRRFFVIDERDRMVNSKNVGQLQTVVAEWDEDGRELTLRFLGSAPEGAGEAVSGIVDGGSLVSARFYSGTIEGRVLDGPWSDALSQHVGRTLRLVEALPGEGRGSAIDRGDQGAVSLVGSASLGRLAAEAEVPGVDARRFRMLVEVDGIAPHAEDAWVGRAVRIGEALVRFEGHVGRCLITSRHPDTGEIDLPTLDVLGFYRLHVDATEPLPFGIYGSVLEEGTVRLGDLVAPEPA